MSKEAVELGRKMMDVVADSVKGTEWAPDEGGVLVDVLVVMIHVDPEGEYGCSWVSAGSNQAAEGMAQRVIRSIDHSAREDLSDD